MERGIVTAVELSGGLAHVQIRMADGQLRSMFGDNGPTVRALREIFGEEITKGFLLDDQQVVGNEIGFEVDDIGLLVALSP